MMSLVNALPGAVAQGLIWGIMAIGVYLTFRILDIADLTVDGSLGTGGAVCIMLMLSGQNVWVSMAGATAAGMVAGLATGILHTFMGIPAILAGILTQLGLYSINLKTMGKANQAINVDKYDLLVSLRFIRKVPFYKNTILIVAIAIIILIAILYWFFGTELGCSLRATGCNDKMARAQGINTDLSRVLGLMISNGLVALSGAMLCQYQGFADINMGRGAIVIGLAAVIIGEAIFGKIFRNFGLKLLGVALGSIIYYLVLQVVIWMGIDTDLLKLLSAAVVAVFLAIPTWKSRYFSNMGKRG
ncbi:ABC transporter permease [Ventrimonas sp. CLA-AP-H27]|uniref:ABC transporter permease n=1 Tax=Ventrimonas faecis TaxID=3133170 RepID=A0ABV1HHZ3_9FIRM